MIKYTHLVEEVGGGEALCGAMSYTDPGESVIRVDGKDARAE
jgi:hypothetical protein